MARDTIMSFLTELCEPQFKIIFSLHTSDLQIDHRKHHLRWQVCCGHHMPIFQKIASVHMQEKQKMFSGGLSLILGIIYVQNGRRHEHSGYIYAYQIRQTQMRHNVPSGFELL